MLYTILAIKRWVTTLYPIVVFNIAFWEKSLWCLGFEPMPIVNQCKGQTTNLFVVCNMLTVFNNIAGSCHYM